ncbi:MAG TPA: radical SAM protein [Puia sp.]|nr:radical SAM protein [Puia sp.]
MYQSPDFHLFESNGQNLLVPDGSRIYGISDDMATELEQLAESKDNKLLEKFLEDHGFHSFGQINDEAPVDPPLTAISLAIAQKCNLGCTYCYAQQGDFGVRAKNMSVETGIAAVDMMFTNNTGSNKMNLAFLGGEPLANRAALQIITTYASEKAVLLEKEIHFSITTNGTLLNKEDAEFFEDYRFAVTVSIDGIGEVHDRLRPMKNGKGSYDRLIQQVTPLLGIQKNMQVSARVTVTPSNLNLKETLNELIALGFHSVGFSPMLSSPNGKGEMNNESLEIMLENMIDCGREFEKNLIAGKRYPFSNMTNALREIHRGTHRPYPCGAGAGYLGVSADGELAACHRFVEDEKGKFGNLIQGINRDIQRSWLNERHVHQQEPCKSCWARYLCGGGCHHEVIHRGRPACDYIRGWLHYTLQAYTNLLKYRPDYFSYHNQP